MDLARVRYILFDAVGTLIYPEPSVAEVYAAAGRRFGSKRSADDIRQRFPAALAKSEQTPETDEARERERWRTIVDEVFDDVPGQRDELFERLWRHFGRGASWQMFPDAADAWQDLSGRGYTLGLASNFDARLVTICRELPLLAECQHIYYASLLGHAKPSPRFFTAIEERLGALPGEILLIGDHPHHDFAAAQVAGWRAIQVDRNAANSDTGTVCGLRSLAS